MREGKVKRILSRNHPEVDARLALRQGALRVPAPARARPDRRPAAAGVRRGLGGVGWDDAVDEAERLLRDARGRVVTALSGSETIEQAYALGAPDARRARLELRGAAGDDLRRARGLPRAARRRSATRS